jgi:ABC-type transporter Mla subunit MlaD
MTTTLKLDDESRESLDSLTAALHSFSEEVAERNNESGPRIARALESIADTLARLERT